MCDGEKECGCMSGEEGCVCVRGGGGMWYVCGGVCVYVWQLISRIKTEEHQKLVSMNDIK